MSIGYACITVGVPGSAQRTTIAKNATPKKLRELIAHNLAALDRILDYNDSQDIRLFRVSSDIIPFGSSPVNTLDWAAEFAVELAALGEKARSYGMRLSMHPGQYTVINSPDEGVVARAVEDLRYHNRFLDALGMGPQHKLILHIGGVYGDKPAAIRRFAAGWRRLDPGIRSRLVVENDDKLFCAGEVLAIAKELGIPMVFDNLHNAVCPTAGDDRDECAWLAAARATWGEKDGPQKMHYSQQAAGRRAGSHSDTIALAPFLAFYEALNRSDDLDIMLEVKDKNLSAVKCVNATRPGAQINRLEAEWARYKYSVLERDPAAYAAIRSLLKDKTAYPAREFYALLEEAMAAPIHPGTAANAAQHVWGYVKKQATAGEAASFARALAAYQTGGATLARPKGLLRRLAEKYGAAYLLQGYYFVL